MFGVASLFCRLGLRPPPSSSFMPYRVANFMAVLTNVSFECDRYHVSSYSILAFGTTKKCFTRSSLTINWLQEDTKREKSANRVVSSIPQARASVAKK